MIGYEINNDLNQAVGDIVSDAAMPEFRAIRDCGLKIFTCLAIKTNKDGEHEEITGDPVTLRKISNLHRTFIDGHYILVVCYYFWNHQDEIKRHAAIHRALMQIDATKEDDEIKLKRRKPEVVEFVATLVRYGAYCDTLIDVRSVLQKSAKQFAKNVVAEA